LPFRFDIATLAARLNFTLTTELGPIYLLGEVAGGGRFEDLVDRCISARAFGLQCRVLNLDTLIATQRAAGRPKNFEASPSGRSSGSARRRKIDRNANSMPLRTLIAAALTWLALACSVFAWQSAGGARSRTQIGSKAAGCVQRVFLSHRPAQRLSLNELHYQIIRTHVVDLADVRMIQRRDRARFLQETAVVSAL
jgi:hypothetical protein